MIVLYCKFPNEAAALAVATALRNAALPPDTDFASLPVLETFPSDGWLNGIYYNIDVVSGTGDIYDSGGTLVPGYHINGLWRGTEDTLPAPLVAYRIYPVTPSCVFG